MTFGDNGQMVDQTNRTYTMRARGEAYSEIVRGGLVYTINLPVKKPGAYQLRVAVRDAGSELVGSANQFIEVPDIKKGRLTMSGLVLKGSDLREQGSASPPSGASSNPDVLPPDEEQAAAASMASPEVRLLKPGMVVEYGFLIYNAKVDKATRQPRLETQVLLFHDGRPVYTGQAVPFMPENQSDWKAIPVRGRLALGTGMEPGVYVLQVAVTDRLAKEKQATSTRWIDFEIAR